MRIGLVCSHGGHLTEMLAMVDAFAGQELFFVTYESPRAEELARTYCTYTLPNIGTSMARMLAALPVAWRILWHERPDVVVSTGSEIALPFFFVARLLRLKTVFVESVCRVHSRSGTGKLIYPLSTAFFVQWPEMESQYGPKARYEGGLL